MGAGPTAFFTHQNMWSHKWLRSLSAPSCLGRVHPWEGVHGPLAYTSCEEPSDPHACFFRIESVPAKVLMQDVSSKWRESAGSVVWKQANRYLRFGLVCKLVLAGSSPTQSRGGYVAMMHK